MIALFACDLPGKERPPCTMIMIIMVCFAPPPRPASGFFVYAQQRFVNNATDQTPADKSLDELYPFLLAPLVVLSLVALTFLPPHVGRVIAENALGRGPPSLAVEIHIDSFLGRLRAEEKPISASPASVENVENEKSVSKEGPDTTALPQSSPVPLALDGGFLELEGYGDELLRGLFDAGVERGMETKHRGQHQNHCAWGGLCDGLGRTLLSTSTSLGLVLPPIIGSTVSGERSSTSGHVERDAQKIINTAPKSRKACDEGGMDTSEGKRRDSARRSDPRSLAVCRPSGEGRDDGTIGGMARRYNSRCREGGDLSSGPPSSSTREERGHGAHQNEIFHMFLNVGRPLPRRLRRDRNH